MPTCLRVYRLAPPNAGVAPVLVREDNTRFDPQQIAFVVSPNHESQSIPDCAIVGITGAEYQAIQLAISNQAPPAGGAVAAGVSSDVFMGAALVAVVAIGWIAGAQR
nr:hypothetical protein [uncultured Duganella sp.]